MFFGLSCCFIEEATAFTARYDIARFGAEVIRGSPRQADLLIISGTVFKKIAPVVLRLYEQMAEPKWVISMGSCSNYRRHVRLFTAWCRVWTRSCRWTSIFPAVRRGPKLFLAGAGPVAGKDCLGTPDPLRFASGRAAARAPRALCLWMESTKSRDSRGPGMEGIAIRGTAAIPPRFFESRSELMWTPPPARIEISAKQTSLCASLLERFGDALVPCPQTSDMPTFQVARDRLKEVLRFLKTEAAPRFRRLEDLTAIDESARRPGRTIRTTPWSTACFHLSRPAGCA